jgi:hypothetical protein
MFRQALEIKTNIRTEMVLQLTSMDWTTGAAYGMLITTRHRRRDHGESLVVFMFCMTTINARLQETQSLSCTGG